MSDLPLPSWRKWLHPALSSELEPAHIHSHSPGCWSSSFCHLSRLSPHQIPGSAQMPRPWLESYVFPDGSGGVRRAHAEKYSQGSSVNIKQKTPQAQESPTVLERVLSKTREGISRGLATLTPPHTPLLSTVPHLHPLTPPQS